MEGQEMMNMNLSCQSEYKLKESNFAADALPNTAWQGIKSMIFSISPHRKKTRQENRMINTLSNQ